MPWNPRGGGGGPWGGGGGGNGPWGRPGGGPGGGGPLPGGPDIEDFIRKGQERLRRAMPGGPGGLGGAQGLMVLAVLALAAWAFTGIYKVGPDEQGVVLRFGKWVDTTEPGLHYRLPYPIETVLLPKVTKVNQLQLGYRSVGDTRGERGSSSRGVPEESRMLTGDENIVEADAAVFWRIKDAGKFLFNVRDPEATVKVAAESSLREVIGRNPIQAALSDKREQIAIQAQEELQKLLDAYGAGIHVQQVQLQKVDPPAAVIDAFNDVQRARADQERARNEAEAYRNDIIPRARGEVERITQEAQAYREQVVDLAQGDAKRFLSLLGAYKVAEDVTARRMYIETMEEVVKNATKIVIDPSAKGGQGVIPYLPLPEIKKQAGGAK
ncbi:HflK protein [Paramagnetospirillum marisnigri]|uniref:Protein HflK n=1 Tax=Paramagnetospirillum marisnigri TaxID=1285242 RepID=A0A178MT08_9PROT|nr:FtsH protease activity modulator HflK [Paramagnetospirillum marisnigri]OAN51404.1 HflK protein [Paramagnetospirillum marisnigri]